MLHKYSIVQNFKEPMKAIETAVHIVLKVSKNSHGNVCSEVLDKVVACQHGIFLIVADQNFPQIFRTHRSSHCKKVSYKKKCS